jgi:hypothetical protein
MKNPNSPGGPEGGKFLPVPIEPAPASCQIQRLVQLQNTADSEITSQTISIIPGTLELLGFEGFVHHPVF